MLARGRSEPGDVVRVSPATGNDYLAAAVMPFCSPGIISVNSTICTTEI